jgi:hypothetical protein
MRARIQIMDLQRQCGAAGAVCVNFIIGYDACTVASHTKLCGHTERSAKHASVSDMLLAVSSMLLGSAQLCSAMCVAAAPCLKIAFTPQTNEYWNLKHVHTTIRPSREQKKLQLLTAATAFRHTQTQVHDTTSTVSSCRLG